MHWDMLGHLGGLWAFLIAVLVLVGLVSRGKVAGRQSEGAASESPEQILKKRFAAGEINEEQYQEARQDLRRTRSEEPTNVAPPDRSR
jgi:putative membrane protein